MTVQELQEIGKIVATAGGDAKDMMLLFLASDIGVNLLWAGVLVLFFWLVYKVAVQFMIASDFERDLAEALETNFLDRADHKKIVKMIQHAVASEREENDI